jgi:hypothetical protein
VSRSKGHQNVLSHFLSEQRHTGVAVFRSKTRLQVRNLRWSNQHVQREGSHRMTWRKSEVAKLQVQPTNKRGEQSLDRKSPARVMLWTIFRATNLCHQLPRQLEQAVQHRVVVRRAQLHDLPQQSEAKVSDASTAAPRTPEVRSAKTERKVNVCRSGRSDSCFCTQQTRARH